MILPPELTHQPKKETPYRAMIAVRDADDLCLLTKFGCNLARNQGGDVWIITVNKEGKPPAWLDLERKKGEDGEKLIASDICPDVEVHVSVQEGINVAEIILDEVGAHQPNVLLLGWSGQIQRGGRYTLGRTLDPLIQSVTCDVMVLRGECPEQMERILIPVAGGPHAPRAMNLALTMAPEAEITALYVAMEKLGSTEVLVGHERLKNIRRRTTDSSRVRPKVVTSATPVTGIIGEAQQDYDLMIIGAGEENVIGRFLFGNIPQMILQRTPVPTLVMRSRLTQLDTLHRRIWQNIFGLAPALNTHEQAEVYKNVHRNSRPSADFFVMITLAAAIATIGLLLDNPAVIIGAMIVAPLMTPILGMGLSLVMGESRFFWISFSTTFRGILLAIITSILVASITPGASITAEILGRAKPTVMDLAVALISGAAAGYALCRKNVSAALAGVAIAAALAPPLTVIGIGIILRAWQVAGGALVLFLTNVISIVAAGGLVFFLLGFRPNPKEARSAKVLQLGSRGVAFLLLIVTIFLGVLTWQSFREINHRQRIEDAIRQEIAALPNTELIAWRLEPSSEDEALYLDVTVRSSRSIGYSEARHLQEQIAAQLEQPVALALSSVPTNRLQAYVPPTPTSTPPPTPTGALTATSTPTSTPIPTSTPTPTTTPTPTPTPTITPTPTPTPRVLFVDDVGSGGGLRVRYAPGGEVMGRLPENTRVVVIDGPIILDETPWYRVRDPNTYLEGWVSGEYLRAAP